MGAQMAELPMQARTKRSRPSATTPRQTAASKTAGEDQDDMPLPTEPRTFFLGGLFLLALLAALYVASPIVLPVVLAIVLKLLLQPLVRLTDRAGVPHGLGAAAGDPPARRGDRRVDQRRRRSGGVMGRQTARGAPADPAAARLPRPPDQLVPMDDGAAAERDRRRASACRRRHRSTRSTSWGRCSAEPPRLRPACSPRWSCCSTFSCRARHSCVASSRSCPPSPRSVRP